MKRYLLVILTLVLITAHAEELPSSTDVVYSGPVQLVLMTEEPTSVELHYPESRLEVDISADNAGAFVNAASVIEISCDNAADEQSPIDDTDSSSPVSDDADLDEGKGLINESPITIEDTDLPLPTDSLESSFPEDELIVVEQITTDDTELQLYGDEEPEPIPEELTIGEEETGQITPLVEPIEESGEPIYFIVTCHSTETTLRYTFTPVLQGSPP